MNAIAQIGRPTAYSDEVAARLCEVIANGGSLEDACEAEGLSYATVRGWLARHDTFATNYAHAKQLKLDLMADRLAPLASEARGQTASEVQAIKLEVDTQKWLLSKLAPHTYGDKLDVTSKGEALAAPSHMVDARVQSIVMQAAARMKAALSPEALDLLE